MRIPFLILCLAVVYGACRTYGREESNIDLTGELKNNGDNKFDLAPTTDLPLEKFLSRHRRFASLLSPLSSITSVTNPIDTALKLFGLDNCIISTMVDGIKFISGALTGQDVCLKVEKLSLNLNAILHPIETAKTVVCYTFQTIGSGTRALIGKGFELASQFFRNVFLPGLHTMLNIFDKTGLLPPQISAMIKMFNIVYSILQISGYVPK
ncbi:uncharacterized protein LOC112464798 [Temnothorax curvispinosus]|uniref:Uncharacterized protein LOC112464798 n=1 Tax=Temnothorax curvispinosus TaxID=300111 RepID=A0A6J1QZJ7_9HYME|nr:uncharacterized protein LOC112464798 [Temnothorax curvispinosus]